MSHHPQPRACVRAIEYYLPDQVLSTEALSERFPEWSVAKIDEKTGIRARHIAPPEQCASDLAVEAAQQLFGSGACTPQDIDFILLCTQSPDYFLPTTACLLQDRLRIPRSAGALDFNLGCSGFVYGLGLAQGLIETGQAKNVLLLTAETYSKFMHERDRSSRTIFGDAAAATLVSAVEAGESLLGPFVYGTDGSGGDWLIVKTGGARFPRTAESAVAVEDESGNARSEDSLFMDGAQIFSFTIAEVPSAIQQLLSRAGLSLDDVDLFVFHQANKYMLDHLRRRIGIPPDKFCVSMSHCGNTVSSTIPVALKEAARSGTLRDGMRIMLVGFGVGLSWAATMMRWSQSATPPTAS